MSDLRSIGDLSRESGLTVSALRFYDGAGVLVPAHVDPQSGYRWYAPEQFRDARVLARLRRVGLPLPDLVRVLAARPGPGAGGPRGAGPPRRGGGGRAGAPPGGARPPPPPPAEVDALLAAHLRRLEGGLADARRELAAVRTLLHLEDSVTHPDTTRATVDADRLAPALDAVRFAVSGDPALPALGGVLLELGGDALRVTATDRYRLAVGSAPCEQSSGPVRDVLLPVALVDELRGLLAGPGPVEIAVAGDAVTCRAGTAEVRGTSLPADFPDHRRLVAALEPGTRAEVHAGRLREELAAAETRTVVREQDGADSEVCVLALDADGALSVGAAAGTAEALRIGVDREFLLQALAAAQTDQLVLELGGPIAPLAVRVPDQETFSLLMPVRLP